MSPAQYVGWAKRTAEELNLSFDGTPERISTMIRSGQFAHGDLFLDYDVKGNLLSRNGLNALIKEALDDPLATHVLIPRRDRLARPDDPLDGIKLENVLRLAGKTIVYMDRTLPPLKKGGRADVSEIIMGVLDFDRAEKDRRDLAQKIIYAQLQLAKLGFSTGGRPPYGFRRWLVKDDSTRVRELMEKERVRMAGHHVVWLPTAEAELSVIRRILGMLETMPASRVAA
jgi:DNA invertase Pin-like site-specific DNA recombinase